MSGALMQYDDDAGAYTPSRYLSAGRPFQPAFSPGYERDGLLLAGSEYHDRLRGMVLGSVFRCVGTTCSETLLGPGGLAKVRPATDFITTGRIYAFNNYRIFSSQDAGSSFATLPAPWDGGSIQDVLPLTMPSRLLALVVGEAIEPGGRRPAGLYLSPDGGMSWKQSTSTFFTNGALIASATDDRVIVGLPNGIACSTDAGATWRARCPIS
jgi:hypothetical protein